MNENNTFSKTIGIWLSEKKSQKFNWKELKSACNTYGYNFTKLNLEKPLEHQGRIDVFLHKLVDIIASADQGDSKAAKIIGDVEQYLSNHPNITVIDKLDNVRILLNRYKYYTILQEESSLQNQGIFTPTFAEFVTSNIQQNLEIMRQRGVTFPIICKPNVAHGSKSAHEMVLIFNERGLNVCKPPCVVQSFVNHNAVLHKVFIVGNRYNICERPSLKNFYPSEELDPIYYRTGEVCKVDSQSTLSILDPHDATDTNLTLDEDRIKTIIRVLRKRIGLLLTGIDVVIDNATGHHAVIDINVFPSYDNFPNFFEHLMQSLDEMTSNAPNATYAYDYINDYQEQYALNGLGLLNVRNTCGDIHVKGMNDK